MMSEKIYFIDSFNIVFICLLQLLFLQSHSSIQMGLGHCWAGSLVASHLPIIYLFWQAFNGVPSIVKAKLQVYTGV